MHLIAVALAPILALLALTELHKFTTGVPVERSSKQLASGPFIFIPPGMILVQAGPTVPMFGRSNYSYVFPVALRSAPLTATGPMAYSPAASMSDPTPVSHPARENLSQRQYPAPTPKLKVQPADSPAVDDTSMPPCKKMIDPNICLDVPDYPEETIVNAVRQTLNEVDADLVLTADTTEGYAKSSPDYEFEAFDFRNNAPSLKAPQEGPTGPAPLRGIPVCRAQEAFIRPRMMRNENKTWRYIVNGKRYLQELRVETCIFSDNDACQNIVLEPFTGRQGVCRQKYILRRLLAVPIHGGGGKVFKESFPIPSCCACFLE